jgi:lysophospholipase L1-like esterase
MRPALRRPLTASAFVLGMIVTPAVPLVYAGQTAAPADLQWVKVNDQRLQWINVAAWEPRGDGTQPVRVPKDWRDKWPQQTARRALSAAGVTLKFRTNSKKVVFRATLIDTADGGGSPEVTWERARPPYFDVYRDGQFVASVPGAITPDRQDVLLYDAPAAPSRDSEFTVLLPFYYRNAEIIVNAIGIDATARLSAAVPDRRPRVLIHGDSITHGHGVFTPRETYVWQTCEKASCIPLNLGFGGSAWGDRIVAEFIASRNDWDVLVIAIGTNSFGGNYQGKPETAAQYGEKYNTFLATVREKFPTKPIVAMTPIFNRADHVGEKNRNGETPQDYRNAIATVVRQRRADRNLYFVDGLQAFKDPLYLLPTDVVHPNVAGSLKIADTLAAALRPVLGGAGAQSAAGP